ncbi:DUF6773 family protein [Alloiococcus sp. CFN-8]|uniref:DUF6773 family protein n=1 Tax=Alloiococcus sp. CFN-8 TaxID=3416081 RepID=UPI003CE6C392
MNNLKNDDERTLLLRRKVQSDGFQLIIIYLLLSALIQKFFFKASFNQIAVELIGFLAAALYMIIRSISLGINLNSEGSKSNKNVIKGAILSGLGCCIFLFIFAGKRDLLTLGLISIFTSISYLATSFLLDYLNKRKQSKIEEELNKNENDFE